MWHTLTNHPSHQKEDGDASKPGAEKSTETKKDDKPNDEEPKKKSSGSGSG